MKTPGTSLSRQLLKAVLSIYIVITLVVTLAQMGIEYLYARKMIQTELASAEKTFYPALSTALWEMNKEQLDALQHGIVVLPAIKSIRIIDPAGHALSSPIHESLASGIEHTFKVTHHFSGQDIYLADVTFISTGDVVLDRVKLGYQMLLISALIKSTALLLLFIWAFRRRLGIPLGQLTEAVASVDLDTLGRRHIDLRQTTDNELSQLEHAFNSMLNKLDHERLEHNAKLESANQNLEIEVRRRTAELEMVNSKLAELSITDGLTGLANRRKFDEVLASEWTRARRTHQSLALIMIDVDYFKKFNDQYGHQAGDECLRRVACILKEAVRRAGDLAARYGGEEFIVIITGADMTKATEIAELLRSGIESMNMPHEQSQFGRVTISAGVAATLPEGVLNKEGLLRQADEALYRAKASGRNRVERT